MLPAPLGQPLPPVRRQSGRARCSRAGAPAGQRVGVRQRTRRCGSPKTSPRRPRSRGRQYARSLRVVRSRGGSRVVAAAAIPVKRAGSLPRSCVVALDAARAGGRGGGVEHGRGDYANSPSAVPQALRTASAGQRCEGLVYHRAKVVALVRGPILPHYVDRGDAGVGTAAARNSSTLVSVGPVFLRFSRSGRYPRSARSAACRARTSSAVSARSQTRSRAMLPLCRLISLPSRPTAPTMKSPGAALRPSG